MLCALGNYLKWYDMHEIEPVATATIQQFTIVIIINLRTIEIFRILAFVLVFRSAESH